MHVVSIEVTLIILLVSLFVGFDTAYGWYNLYVVSTNDVKSLDKRAF